MPPKVALPVAPKVPKTFMFPVVVAPPLIVKPPICVPEPIVEEPIAAIPTVSHSNVEVEFALVEPNVVGVNGKICASDEDEILLLKRSNMVLDMQPATPLAVVVQAPVTWPFRYVRDIGAVPVKVVVAAWYQVPLLTPMLPFQALVF